MNISQSIEHVKKCEKDLNCKLLVGKIGGKGGGGSTLTPEARKLISFYEKVNLETKEFVKNEIEKFEKEISQTEN